MKRAANPEPSQPVVPASDALAADSAVIPAATSPTTAQLAPTSHLGWLKRHWRLYGALVAVVALAGGALAYNLLHHSTTPAATVTPRHSASPTPTPTPQTVASPLTGLAVSRDVAASPIVGVIIENHPDARPQSGLGQAGVVYEANAEGGITRFEAFFEDALPAVMGPIRSLRTYFLDWGLEFNAPVVHAGGNADALDEVSPLGMKDINALYGGPSQYFYRSTDRFAPHNLYTNASLLGKALSAYGFNKPSSFTPSPRKADQPSPTPAHPNIHINFSYNGYQVDYTYAAATNDYARNLAGIAHIDRNTGAQIHVKNVVVEYVPTSYGFTRIGEDTVIMQTVGQGQGIVFEDGTAIPITWKKTSRTARTQLIDATGHDVALNAGNTWYSIVPVGNSVSY